MSDEAVRCIESDALVVALGARTALGLRAKTSAAAALAGLHRLEEHPYMKDQAGDPFVVGMDRTFQEHDRYKRIFTLAQSALGEVLEQLPIQRGAEVEFFLGLPEAPQKTAEDLLQQQLCRELVASVAETCRLNLHPIAHGNASGVLALERALVGLRARTFACCIIGGADSWIDPDLIEPLDRRGQIASATNRFGFCPGEGAAMLAVCSPAFARQHSLTPLAKVTASAVSMEANRIYTETICLGRGLARALSAAASVDDQPVDKQFCDVNGQRYREHEFSHALMLLPSSRFVDSVAYEAPADRWGHVGAATAPMLALLPIVAHELGRACYRRPLIWCGSNSGVRGAMVLGF